MFTVDITMLMLLGTVATVLPLLLKVNSVYHFEVDDEIAETIIFMMGT